MLTIRPIRGKLCVLNEVTFISIHNINVVVINDKFAVLFPMVGTVVASNRSRRAPVHEASIEHNYYCRRLGGISNIFCDYLFFYHNFIKNTHFWMQAI